MFISIRGNSSIILVSELYTSLTQSLSTSVNRFQCHVKVHRKDPECGPDGLRFKVRGIDSSNSKKKGEGLNPESD